jgi:hypothetical protein
VRRKAKKHQPVDDLIDALMDMRREASESGETLMMPASHHTRQGTCFTMGWFTGQANACWNSSIFTTSPLTR